MSEISSFLKVYKFNRQNILKKRGRQQTQMNERGQHRQIHLISLTEHATRKSQTVPRYRPKQ